MAAFPSLFVSPALSCPVYGNSVLGVSSHIERYVIIIARKSIRRFFAP
jgi:hypothetical protein